MSRRETIRSLCVTMCCLILGGTRSTSRAQDASPETAKPAARPFRMGFTAFPHDVTSDAISQVRRFVGTNADLIAHHIEGVPWAEALRNEPFPAELMRDRETKRSMTPPGAMVYLAVSPGRGELKLAEKGVTLLPPELKSKSYDDPLVQKAFLYYCRRSIEFFKPDYLAIGIEVNEIYSTSKEKCLAYADLHRHVYQALKKENPNLPIFASYTLHSLIKARVEVLKSCQDLMAFNDLVAVSYYPFLADEKPERAFEWLFSNFDGFDKPYAMVETNEAAERLEFPKSGIIIDGSPGKQENYLRTLLGLAEKRRFKFVVLFIHQDYDPLWETIKSTAPELFMAWRDCGLIDELGRPRPAYGVWRQYLTRRYE
jgi:hypothetical protein